MFSQLIQQSSSFVARILVSLISLLLSVVIVRLYTKDIVGDFFFVNQLFNRFSTSIFVWYGPSLKYNVIQRRSVKKNNIRGN